MEVVEREEDGVDAELDVDVLDVLTGGGLAGLGVKLGLEAVEAALIGTDVSGEDVFLIAGDVLVVEGRLDPGVERVERSEPVAETLVAEGLDTGEIARRGSAWRGKRTRR